MDSSIVGYGGAILRQTAPLFGVEAALLALVTWPKVTPGDRRPSRVTWRQVM